MASNPSDRKIGENVAKLESRARALQMENQTLQTQVLDARSNPDARTTYLEELQYKSQQRRRNKQQLISVFYWVLIAMFYVHTGFVGFFISIPAQRTFPAPIRVFYGTAVFGIKQILDIFLPTTFIILLPLFGIFALYLLDKDRSREVSNQSRVIESKVS